MLLVQLLLLMRESRYARSSFPLQPASRSLLTSIFTRQHSSEAAARKQIGLNVMRDMLFERHDERRQRVIHVQYKQAVAVHTGGGCLLGEVVGGQILTVAPH